jgi:hypothetical protein
VELSVQLVGRGGSDLLPELRAAFAGVTCLETTSFLKTMMRYHAVKGDPVGWWPYPTAARQQLDDLFETNWEICRDAIAKVMRRDLPSAPAAAVA